MSNQVPDGWIQTFTGRKFDVLRPQPASICIEDIAHALSQLCRFVGHTRQFYSVAQHSVLVSMFCPSGDALHGLLHDASEAYLSDIAQPVKHQPYMALYRQQEAALQAAIYVRFGLDPIEPASVKLADRQLLATEAAQLLGGPLLPDWPSSVLGCALPIGIEPQPPSKAAREFLQRYESLLRLRAEAVA